MMTSLTAADLTTLRDAAKVMGSLLDATSEVHDGDCLAARYARLLRNLRDANCVLVTMDGMSRIVEL